MNTGIAAEHLARLHAIFIKHPHIIDVILYGSRAKGTHREGSDIDIALKGTTIDARLLAQIDTDYDALYLPWKLDLCAYEQIANVDLKSHIDRVGVSLFTSKRPGIAG